MNNSARMVNTSQKDTAMIIGMFLALFSVIIFLIIMVVVPLINRKSGFVNPDEEKYNL